MSYNYAVPSPLNLSFRQERLGFVRNGYAKSKYAEISFPNAVCAPELPSSSSAPSENALYEKERARCLDIIIYLICLFIVRCAAHSSPSLWGSVRQFHLFYFYFFCCLWLRPCSFACVLSSMMCLWSRVCRLNTPGRSTPLQINEQHLWAALASQGQCPLGAKDTTHTLMYVCMV